jgi:hypothetical protein
MPQRPGNLPHSLERTALQRMHATRGMTAGQLYPVGPRTIAGMIAKGWVERQMDANAGETYCITPSGEAALKAKIPDLPRRR